MLFVYSVLLSVNILVASTLELLRIVRQWIFLHMLFGSTVHAISMGVYMFWCTDYAGIKLYHIDWAVFWSGCVNLHSHQQCMRILVSYPPQHLIFLDFLILVFVVSIFLMTNKVKYPFQCLSFEHLLLQLIQIPWPFKK